MSRRLWSTLVGVALGAGLGSAFVRSGGRRRGGGETIDAENARLRAEADERRRETEAIVRRYAHDLRNPLTTIRARAELLKRLLGDGHADELKHVEAILRGAQKLEATIAQLSSTFRTTPAEPADEGAAGEPQRTPS